MGKSVGEMRFGYCGGVGWRVWRSVWESCDGWKDDEWNWDVYGFGDCKEDFKKEECDGGRLLKGIRTR
ncbi:hypothetical protein, partial [Siminovitchia fortis]|uniref:hypothetical protein n=1 Tax=Siminovitchia fortis TaxID=254758 RepID=UPI001C92DBF9